MAWSWLLGFAAWSITMVLVFVLFAYSGSHAWDSRLTEKNESKGKRVTP